MRDVIAAGLFLVLSWCAPAVRPAPPGVLEGHLKIVSLREVDLADGHSAESAAEAYAAYPLVVRSADERREIVPVAVDRDGNYRISLPAGDYVLDVQDRAHRHVRARPMRFTIVSGRNARVDMEIDTGVR